MQVISSYGVCCTIHQFNNPTLLSTKQAEFIKHGHSRNWLFQNKGSSLVHKPVRFNCARIAASNFGNVDELQSDYPDNYEEEDIQVTTAIQIKNLTEEIKHMLSSMGDGRSSVSPYDTAWVSFIRDTNINGSSERPLFPSCLKWIEDNQLPDGSWGEELVFCIYDRLLNTLACVVALTLWNTSLRKRNKGVMFIKENLSKLETGEVENMTCGFEFVFPALLEKAQKLDIDIPYDVPVLMEIYARREAKFTSHTSYCRIPKDVIHTIPTTVLFSLEGLRDLDWQRLLKLQMQDGSFLTSPASTAIAFMETNDQKCLGFLQNVVEKCNGGVPHSYPVDMQARLWAIDRLQRLGISYYFAEEFKQLLDHVSRYWNEEIGIFGGRNSNFCDVDDTCMAIRLLRLHGFDVSPDVLNKFKDGDQFFCLRGELNKSPTAMYNLYRCSQALFPGEKILEEAKNFTYNFLQQCLANNQSSDKWVIAKDIPGEMQYALEFPWYASLPRVESRLYIEQYGGADDIWIGKTLYRMPDVSNNVYLQAAKLDYNRCQSQHRFEWLIMQEWYEKCNFQHFGISKKYLLVSYFLAAASTFEVEKSRERLAWAKSRIICKMITSYFNEEATDWTTRNSLLMELKGFHDMSKNSNKTKEMVLNNLRQFLHQLSKATYEDLGREIHHQLHNAWETWLMSLREEKNTCQEEAELLVQTIYLSAGHMKHDEILFDAEYNSLSILTNKICRMLNELQNDKISADQWCSRTTGSSKATDIELDMQALVNLVFGNYSSNVNQDIKQIFFAVAKTFYYTTHITEEVINFHISKVLFQQV
ncbi:copal-8-ol diphosphate hydratase, chloroplastic-like isoform X1 [Nicotiana sylvestris]|uniref:Copal-8-ol diphosphate hydratase, chloroplastic-like isoform X1 n=1 Tax=Nicotiana sylvestris TaxID=4096 RepID=A0A1U7X9J5_NICSY|nr:PREDICTED: copal-8-ol diphosphate hydratase, chloroplastic-like isoform X1 [Nicotiana sylvestris]